MRPEISIAMDWAIRCFGFPHVKNKQVRALRLLEESMELAQACGVPKEKIAALADYVYGRERGDITQEMGGVLMTAYVMCAATMNENPDTIFMRELRRVLNKSPEEFAKRNQDKVDAGFAGAVPVFRG